MSEKKKLIVIGGGASGFFCAVNAARFNPDLQVIILEKSAQLLSKVRISGGGRCNVTHAIEEIAEMLDAYPRGRNFMRKTLHIFSPKDTEAWFNERGVMLKVEADGRMFPTTDRSQSIIDCLLQEADCHKVEIRTRVDVASIEKNGDHFFLQLKNQHDAQEILQADLVCIAAGGQPKLSGFQWLQNLGIAVETPVPSLFTFNIPDKKLHGLMGVVAKEAMVKIPSLKLQETGPVLITHWGLSGPAVLKLSSRAARDLHQLDYSFDVLVNWTPSFHESALLELLKQYRQAYKHKLGSKTAFELTSRLWEYLLERSGIDKDAYWTDLSNAALAALSKCLTGDRYQVQGKTTFKEEFVTAGGIKLEEIDPLSMESKKIKGLYFTGEILNVDGITGGYNFQHAWSSGFIAAQSIAKISS
jgi:predicted Rossmann fold flavoprotein